MPGVTLKVSPRTRERVKALADRSHQTMHAVLEEALDFYEKSLRNAEYLEGWRRFQEDDPKGFAEYMQESREIEEGLIEVS